MLKKSALALAAAAPLLLAGCDDGTDARFTFYLTDGKTLYTVNGSNPIIASRVDVANLNGGTELVALDVNPRGGLLNGLGSDGQAYLIDIVSGTAQARGTADTAANLAGKAVEMDYNPTVANQQVYRYVTSTGDNVRRNDATGARVGTDAAFAYRTGDVNAGKAVVVSGIAYTNSQLNTGVPASTTVYAIDSLNDTMTVLGGNPGSGPATDPNNPNAGQLSTVGPLGVNVEGIVGFDILNADEAYVVTFEGRTFNLFTADLATGALSFKSVINPAISNIRAFAVQQQ